MRSILTASTALALIALSASAHAQMLDVEKDELTFGFIKLTDMAPLAVAYELGYFEEEGLFVTLEPQANWKVLLDGVIEGRARRRPHAGRSAARGDHRLRHRGSYRDAVLDGPQRQRDHGVERDLGGDEAQHPARGRKAGSPDRRRGDGAGGPELPRRGQALQHGHGVPGLHPQLRAALLAGGRRAETGLLRRG